MPAQIAIATRAMDFIRQKGARAITLELEQKGELCCLNTTFAPAVRLGPPHRAEDYLEQEIDGITVYLDRDIYFNHDLTVELNSIFGYKFLSLNGWKLF